MTPDQAAWVRENVWPPELARTRYRHEDTCTCTWPCPCEEGEHHYCLTPAGMPAAAVRVASVFGSAYTAFSLSGILLHRERRADVVHLPHQRPCRLLCRCQHPFHAGRTHAVGGAVQQVPSTPAAPPVRRPRPVPAGQMGLFEEAVNAR